MKNKFYNTKEDRKYLSIVDEYKRYYVTGKSFKINKAKDQGNLIFKTCIVKLLKDLKTISKIKYENIFSELKIGNSKYKKNILIAEYAKDRYFVLQYSDENKNIYRIIIESKSNKSNKIIYQEWIKKNKTFFGLNDALGKYFMRKSARRSATFLKQYVNKVLFNVSERKEVQERDWEKAKNIQKNNKGFLQRKNVKFKQDFSAKYNRNIVAPDEVNSSKRELTFDKNKIDADEEK